MTECPDAVGLNPLVLPVAVAVGVMDGGTTGRLFHGKRLCTFSFQCLTSFWWPEGWMLCPLVLSALALGCRDTSVPTVTRTVLHSPLLIMTSIRWFPLQKKRLIYSFMFIWAFFQKGIELLEHIVRKYNKPPEGSNLTGMLGGRSSDCLMKMNGENCWYQNHVVGA